MNETPLRLPRLFAIIDVQLLASRVPPEKLTGAVCDFAAELAAGGVTFFRYDGEGISAREMLSHARELRRVLGPEAVLIMNSRADLCLAAGFCGVHLGVGELSPEGARKVIGADRWMGISASTPDQARHAGSTADYVAIGPVYSNAGRNPDRSVGLEGVSAARNMTSTPLVAFGGINRANARAVIEAGADSVAVRGDLMQNPRRAAEEFLAILV